MLSNLAGNALKFTSHGSILIEGTEISREGSSAMLEFSVTDTGIGIAPDQVDVNRGQLRPGGVLITPDMVGSVIGQFVSLECKHDGWKPSPKDAHEIAQCKWAQIVQEVGGYAVFTTGGL